MWRRELFDVDLSDVMPGVMPVILKETEPISNQYFLEEI
jgi:glycerol-3-phosphate responsive antiterminator